MIGRIAMVTNTLEKKTISSLEELSSSVRASNAVPYWTSPGDWETSDTTDVSFIWRWNDLRHCSSGVPRRLLLQQSVSTLLNGFVGTRRSGRRNHRSLRLMSF